MSSLRSLSQGLTSPMGEAVRSTVFAPETDGILAGVMRLAREYPFPHSILGGSDAEAYVRELASRSRYAGEGWYGLGADPAWLAAAAYLGIYGFGNGDGHTLWKIRHPLAGSAEDGGCLAVLFSALMESALRTRPGTAKFVIFFGEHEQAAMRSAQQAGFEREACFPDYYRLGERCLVYGCTMR
jgi:hypothetical protein